MSLGPLLLLTAAKFFHFFLNLPPHGIQGHSLVPKSGTWSRLELTPTRWPALGVASQPCFRSNWSLEGCPHVGDPHPCPALRPPGSAVWAALTSRVTTTERVLSLVRTLSGLTQHRSVSQVRSRKRNRGADAAETRGRICSLPFPTRRGHPFLGWWLPHSDPAASVVKTLFSDSCSAASYADPCDYTGSIR